MTDLTIITQDINRQLADPKIATALLETTFKGLTGDVMKKAIMEGVIRGFEFKDFLEKKVYAIPFASGYSLITSIDHARSRGMKSGIVGVGKPEYELGAENKIVSCTITVKRRVNGYVGDFTAQVFFDEYYKAGTPSRPSLWDTKPRTMIAKVAEMHALRKACPDELSQMYTEEEMQKKDDEPEFDLEPHRRRFDEVATLNDLQVVWASLPIQAKNDPSILALKNELKAKLTPIAPETPKVDNEQPPTDVA